MMNDFIKKLISDKLRELEKTKCPKDLACGDDDAWYEATTERIPRLKEMLKMATGDVEQYDSGDLMVIRAGIMQIFEEYILTETYNTTEYLSSLVDQKVDEENEYMLN